MNAKELKEQEVQESFDRDREDTKNRPARDKWHNFKKEGTSNA